jgi:tripartite-type tricarboxylate transporter receptor subunit TctC
MMAHRAQRRETCMKAIAQLVLALTAPAFSGAAFAQFLAPAGTPTQIIAHLHREIVRLVALADVQTRFHDLGFEIVANTPEEFAAEIKQKTEQWSKVIGYAKIKVD